MRGSLLAAIGIAGCVGGPAVRVGVPGTYHGHYTFRPEVSAFEPCGMDERWWVDGGSEVLRAHLARPDGSAGGELYLEIEGVVSERGSFGRRGAYDRQLRIREVSYAGPPREHCPRAREQP